MQNYAINLPLNTLIPQVVCFLVFFLHVLLAISSISSVVNTGNLDFCSSVTDAGEADG